MEEKSFNEALSHAWDAVRLDPKNLYALILLGNILSRDLGRTDEGMKVTKRAYELYPESQLAITNYAAILVQKDINPDLQEELFRKAITLSPDYLNAYYGLVGILLKKEKYQEAFEYCQKGLSVGVDRPENPLPIRIALSEMLIGIARALSDKMITSEEIERFRKEVSLIANHEIILEEDNSLPVPAKLEIASRYGRDYDRLVYKNAECRAYYIFHELEKCKMRLLSESNGKKYSFVSSGSGRSRFIERTLSYVTDKFRSLIQPGDLTSFLDHLANGLGGQVMNCPLDLFVIRNLFDRFPNLRANQVVAVYELISGTIKSVMTGVKGGFPKNVVRVNRILGAVSFLQYRDLIGVDFVQKLEASQDELKLADKIYKHFLEMYDGYYPGDEWLLIRFVLKELHLEDIFTVESDEDLVERDVNLEKMKKVAIEATEKIKERDNAGTDISNETFLENVKEQPAIGMSIMMYMVEAIRTLKNLPESEVKLIAFQLATLGINGISPSKKSGYKIDALPDHDMSGCMALAWYYVSWKIGFPDAIENLSNSLPFENEYMGALKLIEKGLKNE